MNDKPALIVLKGFGVGASMLIPGVSGGSTAIMLGIYDQLIHAVGSFRRKARHNLLFLLLFAVGGLAGMLIAARPLLLLFQRWPLPATYFFGGAVCGSLPMLLRLAKLRYLTPRHLLWPLLGAAIVLLLGGLKNYALSADAAPGTLFLFAAGLFSAAAFILPGVSISYIWLLLGMYDTTMRAIGALQFSYLLPLVLGLLPGSILYAGLLEIAMRRYPGATYLTIAGFLLGSIIQIFPGLPTGVAGWIISPALFALGLLLVLRIARSV